MPKFMVRVSYNADGARGLVKEGGTGRRAAVQKVIENLGGRMETFYFAYGDHDAFIIADFPDPSAGLAVSLAVNGSGAVRASTVPLITPEDMDAACKRSVAYKAPGA
ncbi:MAG: GYD domain-containing protein [Vicinamibacterales bacterium]